MHLFVTRHGKAHPDSESGLDEDRALKGRGVRQAEYIGDQLLDRSHRPSVVYSSGLVRAEQTADIIGSVLNAERAQEPVLGLGHRPSDVIEVLDLIRKKDKQASIMLVGHNPQLESLVAVLCDGPTAMPHRMRTGTCAVLKVSSGGGGLVGAARLVETLRLEE